MDAMFLHSMCARPGRPARLFSPLSYLSRCRQRTCWVRSRDSERTLDGGPDSGRCFEHAGHRWVLRPASTTSSGTAHDLLPWRILEWLGSRRYIPHQNRSVGISGTNGGRRDSPEKLSAGPFFTSHPRKAHSNRGQDGARRCAIDCHLSRSLSGSYHSLYLPLLPLGKTGYTFSSTP